MPCYGRLGEMNGNLDLSVDLLKLNVAAKMLEATCFLSDGHSADNLQDQRSSGWDVARESSVYKSVSWTLHWHEAGLSMGSSFVQSLVIERVRGIEGNWMSLPVAVCVVTVRTYVSYGLIS